MTDGDRACAVAQMFEEAFGVPTQRVGVRRESQLLRWVIQTYRIEIPDASGVVPEVRDSLPAARTGCPGYLIHLNDVHLASKAVIVEALEELGL